MRFAREASPAAAVPVFVLAIGPQVSAFALPRAQQGRRLWDGKRLLVEGWGRGHRLLLPAMAFQV